MSTNFGENVLEKCHARLATNDYFGGDPVHGADPGIFEGIFSVARQGQLYEFFFGISCLGGGLHFALSEGF